MLYPIQSSTIHTNEEILVWRVLAELRDCLALDHNEYLRARWAVETTYDHIYSTNDKAYVAGLDLKPLGYEWTGTDWRLTE